jgi:N-acylneuraminate cytidylyltransferase
LIDLYRLKCLKEAFFMGRTIAIIPARGGSKRIPGKNIKSFSNRPMLGWPVEAANNSGLFDEIVVSTDAPQVAEIAKQQGASYVHKRSANLSDDHTGLRPVIRQAILDLEREGGPIDLLCCLYATAAFVTTEDLHRGRAALDDATVQYATASVRYPHPVERAYRMEDDGGIEMAFPEKRIVRTQDLQPHFHDAGMFFWGRRDAFFTDIPIYSSVARLIEIPAMRAIDIDEPEDWVSAEQLCGLMDLPE